MSSRAGYIRERISENRELQTYAQHPVRRQELLQLQERERELIQELGLAEILEKPKKSPIENHPLDESDVWADNELP